MIVFIERVIEEIMLIMLLFLFYSFILFYIFLFNKEKNKKIIYGYKYIQTHPEECRIWVRKFLYPKSLDLGPYFIIRV